MRSKSCRVFQGASLICFITYLMPFCVCRELKLSSVTVRVQAERDRYAARVAIQTELDEWMVAKAAWQIYHKSHVDSVLYQIPITGSLYSHDLNVTSFVGQQVATSRSDLPAILHARSNTKDMALSYVYSIADEVSKTGISLTEFIDTARTTGAGIPIERYNARELDIIRVYVDKADTGREYVYSGDRMHLICSYKTKYRLERHWSWRRTPALDVFDSSNVHPLDYTTIAKSNTDNSVMTYLEEYQVTTEEIEDADGYVFITELTLEHFDESRHSAIYHCNVNDWSMAARQPWLLTVDKFIEVTSPRHQSPADPSFLFPPDDTYVAIETCSKKGPDIHGTVFLHEADPDCIVCLSLGHTTPTLTKDGSTIARTRIWPLTVRNPYLHLVYVVMERPSEEDTGTYTCSGGVFQHTRQEEVSMTIKLA